jgi:DNA-binding response OmpR family regulator/HPt (histidine-containing phosphotransfer) domain-containing protein
MKILLVEDDLPTRSILADALTAHRYQVNAAADGQMGLALAEQALAEQWSYDLILLDIMIPKIDGLSLCQKLRNQGCQTPILLLTAKDSTTDRIMGLDAGADDYMVKPFDVDELLARVRALLRRGRAIASAGITWENLRVDSATGEVQCGEQLLHLTPKEYGLLELLLLNPKQVFSRRAILDRLWNFDDAPGEETVSTHVKCLRQKLKAAGSRDLIETVHGLGYRLRSPNVLASIPTSVLTESNESIAESSANILPAIESPVQQTQDRIAKIWEKFKAEFFQRLVLLQQAATALQADALSAELQQQAKHEAHKLAGALGVFGFKEGSQVAKVIETLLQQPLTIADTATFASQVDRLQQLLAVSPTPFPSATPSDLPKPSSPFVQPMLLIVDDDLALAERVRVEAIAWNFRVAIATDLNVARQFLGQTPPDIILLDMNFPGENGLSLLQELMQREPKIPVLAFTGQGDFQHRLEVAQGGVNIFLQKPMPTHEIMIAVTQALTPQPANNRVMIVDDDDSQLATLTALLQPLGIEVTSLNDWQQCLDLLQRTAPNLLVLDLEMPGCSGLDLCQVVRNDPKWHHLPVVFWSAHEESTAIDRAFAAGADDYIHKSVDASELLSRIVYRLRRGGFLYPT